MDRVGLMQKLVMELVTECEDIELLDLVWKLLATG